jgi:S1-C subfamily serine protease
MASSAQNQQWSVLSQELANVIEKVGGSVVAVHGRRHLAGSGTHWRSGLVVTANHAIRRDDALSITLPDHSSASATLVGQDPSTDIALLKIEGAAGVATVQTISTTGLKVGHVVVAVGRSHLGDLAASSGIVARLGAPWRTWRGGEIDQLVRPDIRLYPGQSGSALVNAQGQVLGMNTAALARMATITVPTATVERVVGELIKHGHIRRPYLGLAMQMVTIPQDVSGKLKLESATGLLVMHLEIDGPGSKAGVMLGDVIISIQGHPASEVRTMQEALVGLRIGDPVRLTVIRGGEKRELNVTAGDRPTRK